jgi:hypothetical protein
MCITDNNEEEYLPNAVIQYSSMDEEMTDATNVVVSQQQQQQQLRERESEKVTRNALFGIDMSGCPVTQVAVVY